MPYVCFLHEWRVRQEVAPFLWVKVPPEKGKPDLLCSESCISLGNERDEA